MDDEAYQRAVQKAHDEGVEVKGVGTEEWFNGGGAFQIWFVSSAHSENCYTVRQQVGGAELTCDCTAGGYGKPCKHRLVVHEFRVQQNQQLARAEHRVREPEPHIVTVTYEPKHGRLTTCTNCGAAFVEGETITLRGKGTVWCAQCSHSGNGDHGHGTLRPSHNNQPFSMMR